MTRREKPAKERGWGRSVVYATLIAVALAVNFWAAHRATAVHRERVPYSPRFLNEIRDGNVAEITSRGTAIQGKLKHAGASAKGTLLFATEIPEFADRNALSRLLQTHDVEVNAQPLDTGLVWWKSIVFGFGPTLLFLLLIFWLMRRAGSQGMLGSFGRSRARRYRSEGARVTFADVAGIDEAKFELSEVVDFLKNPARYRKLGGRIPRGVLLNGPPGTGKTLLARAVAGEAEAPFFSMSASEFVEAIVGVGASRVRDLFKQAREAAPAIVFIDELDAVGRARGGGSSLGGGGNDEREQTLNQILTEMDGFDSSTEVIVIAATNRPDILDKALLRPGRFDRRIAVEAPDRAGRRLILEVHTRSLPLDDDVDLGRLASQTPGMAGAELANLTNEAALAAARRAHERVTMDDFEYALERIVLGAERRVILGEDDRRRTAYHEAGHALVGMLTEGADPVRRVTIIPRGPALGVTFSAPDADRFNYTTEDVEARVRVALGGRAAEEIVFGDVTTGAEGDIDVVTSLVRAMVGRWGMSEKVGLVAVLTKDGTSSFGEKARDRMDEEVQRVIETGYASVLALLQEERTRLDALAAALLENETLDEIAAYSAAGVDRPQEALHV